MQLSLTGHAPDGLHPCPDKLSHIPRLKFLYFQF